MAPDPGSRPPGDRVVIAAGQGQGFDDDDPVAAVLVGDGAPAAAVPPWGHRAGVRRCSRAIDQPALLSALTDQITEYLATIDAKVDDVRCAQKD
ncbi:hypothetical protein [Georgenia muralis]|uniref:hypothetical protein n=1 Tax=Georgenia muralis TaxID=154117 RepID=UPI001476FC05|nr:hypothetical protein [Georgenia muralis]